MTMETICGYKVPNNHIAFSLVSYYFINFFHKVYCTDQLQQEMEGRRVIGWAARDESGHLSPYSFTLRFLFLNFYSTPSLIHEVKNLLNANWCRNALIDRKTGPEDVVLKVLYCGVDHTDLHQMRGEISPINYPLVPG